MNQSKRKQVLVGDIGNTETKLCLVSKKNKILKKIIFLSKSINDKQLSNLLKKPNDLLIDKKKISGILQEVILIKNKKFLITGIGINIIKSPTIKDYPTTNLQEVCKKSISKSGVENKLKQVFEINFSKPYKFK